MKFFHPTTGASNIPTHHRKSARAHFTLGTQSEAHSSKNQTNTSPAQQKKKRNASRIQRSKHYFKRRLQERRNNNNVGEGGVEIGIIHEIESIDGSAAISVSSDDSSN